MTKNKLIDLNDHLFMALERLGDESLEGDALEAEIHRSRTVAQVAGQVIANGNLMLDAARFKDERAGTGNQLPPMLRGM